MEVTTQGGCGHGNLLVVEVIARGEGDVPTITDPNVSADIQGLCKLVGIAHGVVIELLHIGILPHGDAIAQTETPGYFEGHIAILVSICLGTTFPLCPMFGFLHVLIDIGLDIIIIQLVIVLALVILLIYSLAFQPFDPVHHLLIIQGVGEVLGESLETAYLAKSPISGMFTDSRRGSHTVCLIDIRSKRTAQVQGVTLGEFQSDGGGKVTQGTYVGCKVIGHAQFELINQTDLLITSRIVFRLDLHLQVIA